MVDPLTLKESDLEVSYRVPNYFNDTGTSNELDPLSLLYSVIGVEFIQSIERVVSVYVLIYFILRYTNPNSLFLFLRMRLYEGVDEHKDGV